MIGWSRIDRSSSSHSAFCRNFPMNLPRKTMFSQEDSLKMKKQSWNRMFVDPIDFDASRFLKKHIFKYVWCSSGARNELFRNCWACLFSCFLSDYILDRIVQKIISKKSSCRPTRCLIRLNTKVIELTR